MLVRPVGTADVPLLLALNQSEVPHVGSVTRERLEAVLAWSDVALVVEDGEGSIAGMCIAMGPASAYDSTNYRWFAARYDDFLYIDRVVVGPSLRRRGAARTMYDAALQAHPAPLLTAEVNVEPPNPGSMAFHTRYGFVEVGREPDGAKTVAMLACSIATTGATTGAMPGG